MDRASRQDMPVVRMLLRLLDVKDDCDGPTEHWNYAAECTSVPVIKDWQPVTLSSFDHTLIVTRR